MWHPLYYNHGHGKDRIVNTPNGTYPWSFRIFTGWFDSCIAAFIGIFSLLLTVEIYGCNRIKYGKLPAILDFSRNLSIDADVLLGWKI
jgi:hypothetical protein